MGIAWVPVTCWAVSSYWGHSVFVMIGEPKQAMTVEEEPASERTEEKCHPFLGKLTQEVHLLYMSIFLQQTWEVKRLYRALMFKELPKSEPGLFCRREETCPIGTMCAVREFRNMYH